MYSIGVFALYNCEDGPDEKANSATAIQNETNTSCKSCLLQHL